MSRCVQFHHLYDKDAEACGMSPVSESYYKRYREAVRKLANQKLDEDIIYESFKEGAYRVILSIKSEDTRTDALSYVSECLHNGEKVTDRDLRGWLKVWRIEHGEPEPEKLTNVNSPTLVPDVKPEVPIKSLGERVRAQEMATATANQPDPGTIRYHCVYPDGCRMRDEEPILHPGLCGTCNSLRPLTDGKGRIVHTQAEPVFKTGNEIAQGLMAPERDPKPEDSAKLLRETMEARAEAFIECLSQRQQLIITDILREEPGWKKKDLLAFGIDALDESRKKGRKK